MDHRRVLSEIAALTRASPDLAARYRRAKDVVRVFRRPAFYETSTRCNLWCEGCYYFADGNPSLASRDAAIDRWDAFFEAEAARGVSMAYFVGAEPALEQARLVAAARHFPHGNIGTNGTVRLTDEIPFRIGVSVWAGTEEADRRLRGASVFRKALKNYAGDRRAIMLFTISRWSVDDIQGVADLCAGHGVDLTFNLYSPTATFTGKLAADAANDRAFFRVSDREDSPVLRPEDLARVREEIALAMQRHPATVLYCSAYNDWSTGAGPLYDVDPDTGIARHCGSRILEPMRYFTTDLQPAPVKCGTPDVDCSECRMYSGGWSSKFTPTSADTAGPERFGAWLDMIETLGRIFVIDGPAEPACETPRLPPVAAA